MYKNYFIQISELNIMPLTTSISEACLVSTVSSNSKGSFQPYIHNSNIFFKTWDRKWSSEYIPCM